MSNHLRINPHKILTGLIAANIIFDSIAIAIWAVFPGTQWSIYRLGFLIIGTEAAIAAGLYAIILFGLIKRKNWASFFAISMTVTQRVFGNFAFFPNPSDIVNQPLILIPNAATLSWSLIIIYFAFKDVKTQKQRSLQDD